MSDKKPTVLVLMSTYNGDKYVEDQINSILVQKSVDVDLFIRDDGSTDRTIDILETYTQSHTNIIYVRGENQGPSKSFMELLYKADSNYDYYAFSDQDDVWNENKLIKAIEAIELHHSSNGNPFLYYSALLTFDDCSGVKRLVKNEREYSFEESLLKSFYPGCTMVFNTETLLLIQSIRRPKTVIMHDLFVVQLMMSTNHVIFYDENSYINYRIHGNNVSVRPKRVTGRVKRIVKIVKGQKGLRSEAAGSLLESLQTIPDFHNKESLIVASTYKDSLIGTRKMIQLIGRTNYSFVEKMAFVVSVIFRIY